MRNNKAILDEAARSVRRTFIGSVAGTTAMLAVVGAAGAYGMPEKLTAQALSAAMAKFNMKFPALAEPAVAAVIERPVKVAENTKVVAVSPVFDVAPEEPVVRTVPQVVTESPAAPVIAPPEPVVVAPAIAAAPEIVAPVAPAAPVIATPAAPVAPVIEKPAVIATAPVVEAAPVRNAFTAADLEPAPMVTASLGPVAAPEIVEQRPLIFAPMVFEAPKPADAQVLTTLQPTEVVVAEPQPAAPTAPVATPQPAERPVQQASLATEPPPFEFRKSVMLTLPLPKPPMSPAQRLELQGKDYDKAEKCLAQAIYFEARNEPARGQQAVAQVVLNRVFSPYYPKDVCSVVYQNAHRHLSCQFTFACDGKPETVNENGAWARANRIATQTLNAKVWLPEVDKATHYHAAYVRPNWIRDMKVMVRYGLHTFYRPRNWGDGSNEAHWGTPANTVKSGTVAAKPAPANKKFALRKT
jgi:spore germination cell wall hydrolase CwlJ-like protein